MWHVVLGWHVIEFPQTSANWNYTLGFDFDHIAAVDMSFCTSLRNFIKIGPLSAEKITSRRFSRWWISAILDFRGPIIGSLKSPCTTSYRSSIETIALKCLVFEKIAYFHFAVKILDFPHQTAWQYFDGNPPLVLIKFSFFSISSV